MDDQTEDSSDEGAQSRDEGSSEGFLNEIGDFLNRRSIDSYWNENAVPFLHEGVVFREYGNGQLSKEVYESVRIYLETYASFPHRYHILARVQGTNNFQVFRSTDIGKGLDLLILDDVQKIYQDTRTRGIIKFDEEMDKRKAGQPLTQHPGDWQEVREIGYVFNHIGLNDTFETCAHWNLPDLERTKENSVILAKSHNQRRFVEFTSHDLDRMQRLNISPKYCRWETVPLSVGSYRMCYAQPLSLDHNFIR